MRDWTDYFYPETIDPRTGQGVLRNNFGERDPEQLRRKEEARTKLRLAELSQHPIEPAGGRFDFEHMKAIHRHIFQDVYEWAGEARTAPWMDHMTKTGSNVLGGTEPIAYAYYPASGCGSNQ